MQWRVIGLRWYDVFRRTPEAGTPTHLCNPVGEFRLAEYLFHDTARGVWMIPVGGPCPVG